MTSHNYLAIGDVSFFHHSGLLVTLRRDVAARRDDVAEMKPVRIVLAELVHVPIVSVDLGERQYIRRNVDSCRKIQPV